MRLKRNEMKIWNPKVVGTYLLMSWLLISCACLLQGCFSGTGFEKKATLMPDSVGFSYTEESVLYNRNWYGFTIGATWNLK